MRDIITTASRSLLHHIHTITLTNQWQCYVITSKLSIAIFVTVENQTFQHLRKTNVNKRCLFVALSKDFFHCFCWQQRSHCLRT